MPEMIVYDIREVQHKYTAFESHTKMIKQCKLSNDARLCLTSSADGSIKLWDIGEQKPIKSFKHHLFENSVGWCFAVENNFKFFFSGSKEGKIYRVDTLTGKTCEIANLGEA
jgi:WD40 repeat protein